MQSLDDDLRPPVSRRRDEAGEREHAAVRSTRTPERPAHRPAHPCGRRLLAGLAAAAFLAVAACSSHRAPSADRPPATRPPDLGGLAVMVLPVQPGAGGVPDGLDDEIAYWLGDRGQRVRWVFPPEIERALARSPGLDIRLDALAVASFHRAEVKRIGDPLFGDLRRAGAIVDARYALLPVAAGYVPGTDGDGRVEIAVAIIDTIGGAVLWYGIVAGEPGGEDDRAVVASAARRLAQTLFP